jgi:hypothetical protein
LRGILLQIFVLGTGRSGTHWVGYILGSHPDIRITIETPRIFKVATQAAVHPEQQGTLLPQLREIYARQTRKSEPRHYADKSHPVIWYADQVAQWFPDARFVGVQRSPFGTVASMARHPGVSRRQRNWREYGVPNQFLGITEENAGEYDQLSSVEQSALRWRSHRDRMDHLRGVLGDRLLVLDYETLIDDYDENVAALWDFLAIRPVVVDEHRPKVASRDAWREQLSEEDIGAIARITGVPAP